MIDFKPLRLEDKDRISSIICASGCHGADYSFANLFLWREEYKPEIAFLDERMLLFMPLFEDLYAYPKGGGDIRPAVEALLEDAHARGHKLVMRGLTESTLEEFLPHYEGRFTIEENREDADYIYTVDKLADLAGRKLASKRNHINQFERGGDWEFRRVTKDNTDEARDFIRTFYEEKHDPTLAAESKAIREMFTHYDDLGFYGGLLYQLGEPVAFTAATRLDEITLDVHFEKALPHVKGAYPMINREFIRMMRDLIPELEYVNREEDMGIEGLRRAKESYHPDVLLRKYTATEI